MEEQESAHGKLATVDKVWTAPRFVLLMALTLVAAFIILYLVSGWKHGDYGWNPSAAPLHYSFP